MKSIKIQSKRTSSKMSQEIQNKSNYDFLLLNNKPNPCLKQQLASVLAEICREIENKTPVKLNLQDRIKNWLQSRNNGEEETGRVLNSFTNFVIESIGLLVRNNQKWQKSNAESPEKIIRIKSEERVKYRLLRQGEASVDLIDEQNDQYIKQQLIYDLKNANKRLERKLLLLSTEFNKIKKAYEAKIQKYKRLLNSSLMQLQFEANEDPNSDYEELNYETNHRYKEIISERHNNMMDRNLRDVKSQKYRSSSQFENKIERITTQESNKFVSIPSIPILGSGKLHDYRRF